MNGTVYLDKRKGRTPTWTVIIRRHPKTLQPCYIKRSSTALTCKRDALKLRDEMIAKLWSGELAATEPAGQNSTNPNGRILTLAEYIPIYLDSIRGTVADSELERKAMNLRVWASVIGTVALNRIEQKDIDGMRHSMLSRGRTHSTVDLRLGDLHRLLNAAVRNGYMPEALRLEWPRAHKKHLRETWLSKEQIKRICSPELGIVAHPMHRSMFLLGVHAGLRVAEIRGLRWQDVDLESRMLHIRWQCKGQRMLTEPKSKQARSVPISDELHRALTENHAMQASEWVVYSAGDHASPKSYISILRWWKAALKCSGMWNPQDPTKDELPRDASIHCWRHTFATHLARAGVTAAQLQKLLGHSSEVQPRRYCHTHSDDAKAAIAKLSW